MKNVSVALDNLFSLGQGQSLTLTIKVARNSQGHQVGGPIKTPSTQAQHPLSPPLPLWYRHITARDNPVKIFSVEGERRRSKVVLQEAEDQRLVVLVGLVTPNAMALVGVHLHQKKTIIIH